ncbi:MAG TPA: outer membrane protein assembly factor BamD [Ignavibacteriales bacterium]|nr:outer membrane protein assembly factor BamD [Ignavibacteriales bacterium]
MHKNTKVIIYLTTIFISMLLVSCSSTKDLTKLTPSQRLQKAIDNYNNKDYEEAVASFQSILIEFAGREVIDSAQFYLAMSRYMKEEYLLASYEFSKLIQNMPLSQFVPLSQYMLADCYFQLSPPMPLDQKYTKKAIEEFQAFIDFYPNHPKVDEATKKIKSLNEKLAYKDYNAAYIYERMENYNAAIFFYSQVIENYHDTKYAPLALYNRIKVELVKNRKAEAKNDIANFKEKYPTHELYNKILEIEQSLN